MAKKADLESHCSKHAEIMERVRAYEEKGEILTAIEQAVSAFEHIDGMLQYERRYGESGSLRTVASIDCVLRYAPLLFESESLEAVGELLKSRRRIDRDTEVDLSASVDQSRATMWEAHRLWNYLESVGRVRQSELRKNLGGEQEQWRSMAEMWEKIGLLRRTPDSGSYLLSLVTRLDEPTRGKCHECGVTGKAPKSKLLAPLKCPKCGATGYFVILTT